MDPEYILKYRCIIDDIVEWVRELEKPWEIAGGFGTLMIACDRDDRDERLRSIDLPA